MSKSRAQVIRELAAEEGGQLFLRQIYGAFGAVTEEEKKAVYGSMQGLMKTGQMKRVGQWGNGIYEIVKPPGRVVGGMRLRLWRAIRNNRQGFALDDLIEQTDCSRHYAEEYVRALREQGFVERQTAGGKPAFRHDGNRHVALYRLAKDQIAAPENTFGAAKWARKRDRRKGGK